MYAVFTAGGKQYKASEGDVLYIETGLCVFFCSSVVVAVLRRVARRIVVQ